ncbi:VOC family protein [Cupriavidus pampae]|uniref:Virulence protein n=1 Tax=Cupriavidus pampae TaxID=659251 RepID=A0ABN7YNN6_9BURK|nr:VOC family protein [Cupriavidus pampae]CAG9173157.1 Virulence protein [Cupriavidus pampae]
MTLAIDRIDHIVLNVKDVETSAAWYQRVLGMQREDFPSRTGPRVAVKFGQQKINLRPITEDTVAWFTGIHPTSGSDDLCFITRMPPNEVVAHFLAHEVPVEAGPAQRSGALGTLNSVYCRDLDGNLIEVASYPPN